MNGQEAALYCIRENAEIPIHELRYDSKWGWVHEVGGAAHTVTGYEINGPKPRVRNPRFE
jgi:hypothetical protein